MSHNYVIGGGDLLHRVPWPRGPTYASVRHLYVSYVMQKFGAATIVFDGYNDDPMTKYATHLRIIVDCVGLMVTLYYTSGIAVNINKRKSGTDLTKKREKR